MSLASLVSRLQYMRSMGVPAPWSFSDVYGLDDELLMMIPQPCKAIVLLFPVTERVRQSERLLALTTHVRFVRCALCCAVVS